MAQSVNRLSATRPGSLYRVSPEILMAILEELGIEDILACRITCHHLFRASVATLRHHLKTMLRPFLDKIDSFCGHLDLYRSVIGGLFAMAFFLRDKSFPLEFLEVYAPDQMYPDFVEAITGDLRDNLAYSTVFGMDGTYTGRDVLECTHFRLDNNRSIIVYQSSDWTAMSPITRSPCTALINYVSPSSFGCAYPNLTFRKRALLADHAMFQPLPFDHRIMNTLTDNGFDISWSPIRFAVADGGTLHADENDPNDRTLLPTIGDILFLRCGDHQSTPAEPLRPAWGTPAAWERFNWPFPRPTRQCYAPEKMCPKQIRYFGDGMWLMDFFDPLSVNREFLQSHYRVPYGTVVAWKLWSSFRCKMGSQCNQIIPERLFLHNGFVVLPALPGTNIIDRRQSHEHPPIYLYHLG